MKKVIAQNAEELGKLASVHAADLIKKAITETGSCRLLLSTAASQFETLANLQKKDIEWSKVEVFHLDEYIGLPENHGASFVRYLKERFLDDIDPVKAAYFIDGKVSPDEAIAKVSTEIRRARIDVALIGIGENAHIAFNDPPADFITKEAYKIVKLDEACRRQQLGEGWFPTLDDVPETAISMTIYQILQRGCCTLICNSRLFFSPLPRSPDAHPGFRPAVVQPIENRQKKQERRTKNVASALLFWYN